MDVATPAGIRPSTTYFPELESLRGVAILLVALFHAYAMLAPTAAGVTVSPLVAFVRAGHTGVNLFFILSAFLLSLPFLAEAAGGRPVRRRDFYRRRALRILPLYLTAVVVASVASARMASDLLRGLPYFVFLNSLPASVPPLLPFSAVWWSLATEVQFYALLPLLPYGLRSRTGRQVAAGVLLVYALVFWAFATGDLVGLSNARRALSNGLFGRAPLFLLGIGAAWLYLQHGTAIREGLTRCSWATHGGADLVLGVLLVALGFLLQWPVRDGYFVLEAKCIWWHAPEGILWTGVVLTLLLAPLRTKALCSNRALGLLGVLSYSMLHLALPDFCVG